ncbi:MAG TPA: lipoyl(octanoyl) transferase LipB [Burkholderiales bacterium]|nr:lipoyl(octanoyl) transferase LipB [Burkholderiales bacterium]
MLAYVHAGRRGAAPAARSAPVVRHLGFAEYAETYSAMRRFTAERTAATPDELWVLQHPPVYTAGIAGRPEHFPRTSPIALVRADRGGQITYHGPGQAIVYTLVDLERRGLTVRAMVALIEDAVIGLLAERGVAAGRTPGAPGVYVAGAKIAALGLRVRRGGCYHGVALNVDMDLAPFSDIDPCGYPGLKVTQTSALGVRDGVEALGGALARRIADLLESR